MHPYPAKLLVHIPIFFFHAGLADNDDLVADPFCGSGTVLVESVLSSRSAIGADANPFARLLATAKTDQYDERTLETRTGAFLDHLRDRGPEGNSRPDVVNLDYWYSARAVEQLQAIRESSLFAWRLSPSWNG